ncbi:MAG: MopE-related protein, partial [Flavobacteriales bacterium]
INNGGYANTNAPFYAIGATLQYNVGAAYDRSIEWSASTGRGYPHHVTISNNTTINPAGSAGANTGVALQTGGNLTIDSGSSLYLDYGGNNMTVDLVVLGSMTLNGNLSGSGASGSDIFVSGDWTNNGTSANFFPNARAVFLNGSSTQTISGTNASFPAFPYIFVSKSTGNILLARDVQVSTQLVFSSGNTANIDAASFTLNVSATSTTAIDRQGSGHIIGNLRRGIGTGSNSYDYPVGDASNYTPVTLSFNSVTGAGNVTVKSNASEHPQIASSGLEGTLSVNRYFSITNSATSFSNYTATLNFVAGDRDAGVTAADLLVGIYNSGWAYPTVASPTATSIQATSVSSFGDFAIAECKSPALFTVTGGGEYCSGGTGVAIGLDDSEEGVSYQLKKNNVDEGSAVSGTGLALSFGNITSSGTYTVVANSLASATCSNNMTGSTTITINPIVTPIVSITASATTFCSGTSVTFTATPQYGGVTPSYQWKVNATNAGTDTSAFTTSALNDGDVVTVVLTSSENCPSPSTATSNSIEVAVLSFETPEISISIASGTNICAGDLVTINSSPLFGGSLSTFEWQINGAAAGTDSTLTTFELENGDQVRCIFTSDYLCATTPTDTSNTLTFVVAIPPQVDAGANMTTCGTTPFTFANGATNNNTTSIAWTENGAGSITAGANTLTPTYTPAAGDLGTTVTFTLTGFGTSPCAEIADNVSLQVDALALYYIDADGDGFGDPLSSPVASCTPVVGRVVDNTDCCDSNEDINPGSEWWADADGDGVGSFIYTTGCVSGCAGFAQTIPYYPGAHGGAPYGIDCNDEAASAYPGATEACANNVDDDCDGMVDEGCSGIVNDGFAFATTFNVNNTNSYYPNCNLFSSSVLNADISAEGNPANVAAGGGRDSWFRFVAPSSAVRIRVAPTGFNAVIELRTAAHPAGQVDVENANSAVGGIEIMNVGGLTSGQTYYIAVRNYDNTVGGTFTICVSPLMPSGCGTAQAVGGLNLCSSFKAVYRGATSYTFNFTGTGGTAPTPFATTSASSTGLIALSTPALALRNGGIYNVRVDANYALSNGIGVTDPTITILGTACSRTMATAPLMEVTSIQRCAVATLNRSALLRAVTTTGASSACSATSYNFRFTRVADCAGTVIPGVTPFVVSSSSTYLSLNVPFPNGLYPLPNLGYWKVEIAPVFTYGATAYGPARVIQVNNTATSSMLPEEELAEMERLLQEGNAGQAAIVYPNPGNGERVFISLSDEAEIVNCRIFDEMGRVVDGFLVTRISGTAALVEFNQRLASGVYHIQWSTGTEQQATRWIVTN